MPPGIVGLVHLGGALARGLAPAGPGDAAGIGTAEVIRRVAHQGGTAERGLSLLDRLLPAVAAQAPRAARKE